MSSKKEPVEHPNKKSQSREIHWSVYIHVIIHYLLSVLFINTRLLCLSASIRETCTHLQGNLFSSLSTRTIVLYFNIFPGTLVSL